MIFWISISGIIFTGVEILLRFFLYKNCFSFGIKKMKIVFVFASIILLYTALSFFSMQLYGKRIISIILDIILIFGIAKGEKTNKFLTGFIPAIITLIAEILSLFCMRVYLQRDDFSLYLESSTGSFIMGCTYIFFEIILYLSFIFFLKKFKKQRRYSPFFCFLMPIQVALIMFVSDKITDIVFLSIGNISPNILIQDMTLLLFSILGIIIVFCIMINLQGVIGEKERNAVLSEQRINLEFENFKKRHNAVELYQSLKHDMKEFLFLVKSYSENKMYKELQEFTKQLSQSISKYENLNLSENIFFNDLITEKKKAAEDLEISFEIDIQYKGEFGIDNVSLCLLFGNALTNAIEACQKVHDSIPREIYMGIYLEDGWIRILIENSSDGEYSISSQNELKTTKGIRGHGIGMKGMKKIVDSANGYIDYICMKDCFKLKILLPVAKERNKERNNKNEFWNY